MVKKLLHTRYRVTDLEKTVAFYRDVLGLQEVRRHTSGRGSQLVFFKAPGSEEEIEICKFDESGPVVVGPDLTHLAFEVDNIDAAIAKLKESGVTFNMEKTETPVCWMAQFRDPGGNKLVVHKRKEK